MARLRICAPRSTEFASPCRYLQPVVDLLVAHGNRVYRPFFTDKGGDTSCLLADPIDFNLLDEWFEFVAPVEARRAHDVITSSAWDACRVAGRRSWLREIDDSARFYARTLRNEARGAPAHLPAVTDEFDSLVPIERILGDVLNGGNDLVDYSWRWEAGDRSAEVRDPIDFARVRAGFVLPEWIVLDEAHDCIRDVAHDYVLKGPGFH